MAEMNLDSLDFNVEVVEMKAIDVNRNKFDVMTDENGEAATPTSTRTITTEKSISREARVLGRRPEFGFLNTGYFHVVFDQERAEFILGRV